MRDKLRIDANRIVIMNLQNLEPSEPNEICNVKENSFKSVTRKDREKDQTVNGPAATCKSSTDSTYVADSVSDEDKSAAATNKYFPDSIVPENNKDNDVEFDDSECDELPELVPMEEEETEVNSHPPAFVEVDEVKFDVPSSLKGKTVTCNCSTNFHSFKLRFRYFRS